MKQAIGIAAVLGVLSFASCTCMMCDDTDAAEVVSTATVIDVSGMT